LAVKWQNPAGTDKKYTTSGKINQMSYFSKNNTVILPGGLFHGTLEL
jgi:hypothetical protein